MTPAQTRNPETSAERRARQLDYFRRAADRARRAIDIAGEQLETAHAAGEPGATASPTLDLSRATRALAVAVAAENRVVRGQSAPRAPANDDRREPLRDALHKVAKTEPSPLRRAELCRQIDERVEQVLVADPDAQGSIRDQLFDLAREFELELDPGKLSDRLLGMPLREFPDAPTGWVRKFGKQFNARIPDD